jgi:hypothetical protein
VLRLECTQCKTKAQLALKRCKHFELGYVDSEVLLKDECVANGFISTVVTRRPRVLLLCSKRSILGTQEAKEGVGVSFSRLQDIFLMSRLGLGVLCLFSSCILRYGTMKQNTCIPRL